MNDAPTRYAIQKARGSGWKTLEVGEALDQVRARFQAMCRVNAKAYFRIVSLDPLPGASSTESDREFTWKLIELRDPNAGGAPPSVERRPRRPRGDREHSRRPRPVARRRARERVRIPFGIYLAVIVVGLLIGAAVYLQAR